MTQYTGTELTVQIQRDGYNTPWGFRLTGGHDVERPIIVDKVQTGTPAEAFLQKGDRFLLVEGQDASRLTHSDVENIFRKAGGCVTVKLNRAGFIPVTNKANHFPYRPIGLLNLPNQKLLPRSQSTPPFEKTTATSLLSPTMSRAPQSGFKRSEAAMLYRVQESLGNVTLGGSYYGNPMHPQQQYYQQPPQQYYQPPQQQYQQPQQQYQQHPHQQHPQQQQHPQYYAAPQQQHHQQQPHRPAQFEQSMPSPQYQQHMTFTPINVNGQPVSPNHQPQRNAYTDNEDVRRTGVSPRRIINVGRPGSTPGHVAPVYGWTPQQHHEAQAAPSHLSQQQQAHLANQRKAHKSLYRPPSPEGEWQPPKGAGFKAAQPAIIPVNSSQHQHQPRRRQGPKEPYTPAWAGTLAPASQQPWRDGGIVMGDDYTTDAIIGNVVPHQPHVPQGSGTDSESARVVHLQFNSPMALYSKDNASNMLHTQTDGKPGAGTLQLSGDGQGRTQSMPINQSATYKLLHEREDNQPPRRGRKATDFNDWGQKSLVVDEVCDDEQNVIPSLSSRQRDGEAAVKSPGGYDRGDGVSDF